MADEPSTPPRPSRASQAAEAGASAPSNAVVVKKYANRRLYNTETSSYITLDNLAEMIRAGRDFVVFDAKSGDDITRGVLTQIIVDEESKGSAMLPTAFLRQLIGFYGGSLEGVVPRYLEHSMSTFARQQQQVRTVMERTFSPFLPTGVEEMGRQNMALFERAMSMWNPFARTTEPNGSGAEEGAQPAPEGSAANDAGAQPPSEAQAAAPDARPEDPELAWLRSEVDSLRRQLVAAHAAAVLSPTVAPVIPENVLRDPVPPPRNIRRPGRKANDPVV